MSEWQVQHRGFRKNPDRGIQQALLPNSATTLAGVHRDLYDGAMADTNHRSLRLPSWLWQQYGKVVGDIGCAK